MQTIKKSNVLELQKRKCEAQQCINETFVISENLGLCEIYILQINLLFINFMIYSHDKHTVALINLIS